MRFEQQWREVGDGRQPITASAESIERERMFYNISQDDSHMIDPCDVITNAFLDRCKGTGLWDMHHSHWSLDTRSHMLMRGWVPAIPRWHHDDVDRGVDGQPDYDAGLQDERVMFTMVIDASDARTGAMTEFLSSGSTVSVPWPLPGDAPVYRYWHHHIEAECRIERERLQSGSLYRFTQNDFHQAVPALHDGWRWFGRLTVNPGPRPAEGKIRRQSQVYLPVTNKGW